MVELKIHVKGVDLDGDPLLYTIRFHRQDESDTVENPEGSKRSTNETRDGKVSSKLTLTIKDFVGQLKAQGASEDVTLGALYICRGVGTEEEQHRYKELCDRHIENVTGKYQNETTFDVKETLENMSDDEYKEALKEMERNICSMSISD